MEPAPSTEASPKWVSQKVLASPTRGSSSSEDSAGSSEEASGSSEETGASEEVAGAVEEASGRGGFFLRAGSHCEAAEDHQRCQEKRKFFHVSFPFEKYIVFLFFISKRSRSRGSGRTAVTRLPKSRSKVFFYPYYFFFFKTRMTTAATIAMPAAIRM